jgi:hypothetical protein
VIGKLLNQPYNTQIEVGSLQELIEESRSWVNIKTEIAKTHFDFAGSIDLAQVSKSPKCLQDSMSG